MQKRQLVKGTQGPKKTQMDRQALTHGYMRDLQAASQIRAGYRAIHKEYCRYPPETTSLY